MRNLFLIVAMFGLAGCADLCGNQIVSRVNSPDGKLSAVLFQRDCGATTGFSTQISIVPVGQALSGAGNVFQADDDHGSATAADWGGPWADLHWISSDQLRVRYDGKSRVFETNAHVSGVDVRFEKVTR